MTLAVLSHCLDRFEVEGMLTAHSSSVETSSVHGLHPQQTT